MTDQSLLVVRPPGCGKTYWVRERVKALRESGKCVDIIAKTHASVQNFREGTQTADHCVHRNSTLSGIGKM